MWKSAILLMWMAVGAMGCGGAVVPTSPSGGASGTTVSLTLAPGQTGSVSGGLALTFTGVSADSRCPIEALCIQIGDAVAEFQAAMRNGTARRLELRTAGNARRGEVAGYQIELTSLQPYPSIQHPIAASDYRATLTIVLP